MQGTGRLVHLPAIVIEYRDAAGAKCAALLCFSVSGAASPTPPRNRQHHVGARVLRWACAKKKNLAPAST